MASSMLWLRLPPAVRAEVFSQCMRTPLIFTSPRLDAVTEGRALACEQWRKSSRSCLPHRRGYATTKPTNFTAEDNNHSLPPSMLPSHQDIPGQEKATYSVSPGPETPPDKRQKANLNGQKRALFVELWRRVDQLNFDPTRRRAIKLKVRECLKATDPGTIVTGLKELMPEKPIPLPRKKAAKKLTADPAVNAAVSTDPQSLSAPLQVDDLGYLQAHLAVPLREQYPDAPPELFDLVSVSSVIHNACHKQKIAMNSDVDFSERAPKKSNRVYDCSLKLDLSGLCQESAQGTGSSKQAARQAAWLRMVSRLHDNGALQELFPGSVAKTVKASKVKVDTTSVSGVVSESSAADDDELEVASIDKKILEEEKDAELEIYNYAASLGVVPIFDMRMVPSRLTKRQRLKQGKPKELVQVTIRLPNGEISASGVGRDPRTAEVAAALDFKRRAEEHHKATLLGRGTPATASSVLNTETARYFFDYLRENGSRLSLEVEHEQVSRGGKTFNSARLSINGSPIGDAAVLGSKKKAADVAFLTAALEYVRNEPDQLQDFAARLKKDQGKVLRQAPPIYVTVDSWTQNIMRRACVEARDAGLPDSREALEAADDDQDHHRIRRPRRSLSPSELEAVSQYHLRTLKAFNEDPTLEELRAKKAGLPMNQYRAQVLDLVSKNTYSVIIGATGSGKTTQVPQILLEHEIIAGNGGRCNIICTQPRRIAATSVAQRVAVERNEPLQRSVGYHVRFDKRLPRPGGSITYCTTGILLEQLKHEPDILDSVTHLVVDEVHERDIDIDFLMIVIKAHLQKRLDAGKPVPKVVLMSATLDADMFAKYFSQTGPDGNVQPCPTLSVPGRTFPVAEKHLSSIVDDLRKEHGSQLNSILQADNVSQDYLKAELAFSERREGVPNSPTDSVIDWKLERQSQASSEGQDGMIAQEKDEALVPTALVAATIAHLCQTTQDGAVLAFLPGLEEILKTQRLLQERNIFGLNFNDSSRFKICLLHSSVPKEEQAEVFQQVPHGCRKVILSTNIAETSVTVTDVKYVVDAGKLRETRYDQIRRITQLQCVWESKSNAKQRAGRAGRVQDGHYYALFSEERHASLRAVGLPELLRTDLQETALSIKAQRFPDPVESFLAQAIEAPPAAAVKAAVANLVSIEAFTAEERLTDLGRLLAKLPVHPTLGKMVILGVIFQCLDPLLIFGAAAEERSLFVSPISPTGRTEAKAIRRDYAGDELSDHMATLNAFKRIRSIRDQYGMGAAFDEARREHIHTGAFRAIDQSAQQIVSVLKDSGLAPDAFRLESSSGEYGPAALNRNSGNVDMIKCLLLAGFHPNLAVKTAKGPTYRIPTEQNVMMHPTSLNDDSRRREARDKHPVGTLFSYGALSSSSSSSSADSRITMRDTTLVTPLMSILFGGQLQMTQANRLEMDGWLSFTVRQASDRSFATKLVLEFRKALDRMLNRAFRSLAAIDSQQQSRFAEETMREHLVQRVVDVLDHAAGRT